MEVCSFGPLCHTSMVFKNTKLKKCSYPFDWIFSSLETIGLSIEDDFKTFLDKSYYKDISAYECGHTLYNDKLKIDNVNMFNHRNPLRFEKDYQYYIRCVERFRNLLNSDCKKLFTLIYIRDNESDSNIRAFNEILKRHTTNFRLVVVFHSIGKRGHTVPSSAVDDTIDTIYLQTETQSYGVQFDSKEDNDYLESLILERYNLFI